MGDISEERLAAVESAVKRLVNPNYAVYHSALWAVKQIRAGTADAYQLEYFSDLENHIDDLVLL